jgi:hypothetical protein
MEDFDLVVQMGDLIKDSDDKEEDVKNILSGLKLIKQLPFPTINLLGNHELSAFPRQKIENIYTQAGFDSNFFGYKDFPETQIAWTDFELDADNQSQIVPQRIKWMLNTIMPDKPTLFFSHYPLTLPNAGGNFYFENDPDKLALTKGEMYLDKLKALSISTVICAHAHWVGYSNKYNVNQITVPSFSENFASDNIHYNPGIYSILETRDGLINVKSFCGDFAFSNIELPVPPQP